MNVKNKVQELGGESLPDLYQIRGCGTLSTEYKRLFPKT